MSEVTQGEGGSAVPAGERLPMPFPTACRMVVFDLDGTLYRQSPVRRGMLIRLLAAGGGRWARIRDLQKFRNLREELSDEGAAGFDARLYARAAAESGRTEAQMRALVQDWMEVRPLPLLRSARVAGAVELFAALRARGIVIAVWSDYPVAAKLAALELQADLTLAATDPELDTLKPNPLGLRRLMAKAGCAPDQVLMVGDRMGRDGAAAERAGVRFLLRSKTGPKGVARVRDFVGLAQAVAESPIRKA